MQAVRRLFLFAGLVGLFGGVSQLAAGSGTPPWAHLERHVRQTLGTGGPQVAARVDLRRSCAVLFGLSASRYGR
jgi:hypothetical protein